MQLTGGDYSIRAASDDHVRVSFAGNPGDASAEMSINGTRANLSIKDTPHNNFRAKIEVPANSELNVHLAAGNLEIAGITGSKDIESEAGNVRISVPNPDDYGTVDASVKVGNLSAGPLGQSGSGVANHIKKSGPGKYTLRASLGAGNLELKP